MDDTLTIERPTNPLDAAIAYYGSQVKLADAIGYSPQAITMWKSRGFVPNPAAKAIELATQGQIRAASFSRNVYRGPTPATGGDAE